jgi:hypothetical protein
MFVSLKYFLSELHEAQLAARNWQADYAKSNGERERLAQENARMRSDIDWFKLRLNQVEKERAQLILAATGTPMPVATFAPTPDPADTLNEMPEFAMVGADAPDDYPGVNQLAPDMMPGRTRN